MTENQIARLRWSCRRGMLELDLLLLPFVEKKFLQLNDDEQKLFIKLLACEDQDLYCWLVDINGVVPEEFKGIIKKIKE